MFPLRWRLPQSPHPLSPSSRIARRHSSFFSTGNLTDLFTLLGEFQRQKSGLLYHCIPSTIQCLIYKYLCTKQILPSTQDLEYILLKLKSTQHLTASKHPTLQIPTGQDVLSLPQDSPMMKRQSLAGPPLPQAADSTITAGRPGGCWPRSRVKCIYNALLSPRRQTEGTFDVGLPDFRTLSLQMGDWDNNVRKHNVRNTKEHRPW